MVSGTQNAFQSEWKRMDGLEELKITHWDQTEIYFSNKSRCAVTLIVLQCQVLSCIIRWVCVCARVGILWFGELL